ncbi:MAG: DMT family transporter [Tissierellales bacterium]|jgi:drug/metabolite transporter (DMT)-like permease|nr:DMT family transporter [Tissierellales bacterium]
MTKGIETLLAIIGCSFWGLTFIFLKPVAPYASASDLVFWRFVFTAVFLFIFHKITIKKFNFSFNDFKLMLITSFLGFFLYQLFCNFGVSMISGSEAGLIHGLIPIVTIFFERVLRNKKITPLKGVAMMTSIAGIYLISQSSGTANSQFIGYVLMFAGISAWVIYTFISEKLLDRYHGIELLAYQSLLGAMWVIPYNLITEQRLVSLNIFTSTTAWGNLLLSAILSSGIGYILYMRGVKNLGIGTMSFIVNIMPISSLLAGAIILGDPITLNNFFGLILILISVYMILVDNSQSKHKKRKKKLSFSQ